MTLCERVRHDGAPLSADFALSMEEPGELCIPYSQFVQIL